MALLSSYNKSNNQKLYFSKEELTKILGVYSQYVAKGEWKDYAMDFDNKNAFFYTYKNTNTKPDCIFTKYKIKLDQIGMDSYELPWNPMRGHQGPMGPHGLSGLVTEKQNTKRQTCLIWPN